MDPTPGGYAAFMSAARLLPVLSILVAFWGTGGVAAQNGPAQNGVQQDPADPRLLRVDREKREVRVLCQSLLVEMPLEFFCVLRGTVDHETVLRTTVKPSAVHAALLGLGLEPGHPLRFEPERKQWIAPTGPPLRIEVEWEQDGKTIRRRAGELMRNMKSGEAMPPHHWVFSGSALGPNGEYGADMTGQLVSIVNFEYTAIDIPRIASNANETLEWEVNREVMPPEGTEVWMIITPVEGPVTRSAVRAPETRAPQGVPIDVVVVMLDGNGQVKINSEPVALAETGRLVKERAAGPTALRLTAPRGAPVDELGRLLGELVRAEITDVTFVPPPPTAEAAGDAADDQEARAADSATRIEVHDGGREVSVEGRRQPLGQFVQAMRQKSPLGQEPGAGGAGESYVITPAEGAQDLKPVDYAAVHAALYVLGFEVRVEAPGYGSPRADSGDGHIDARLAELRRQWEQQVLPQADSMQRAAQLHYEVMETYQREINQLLDEVERLRQEMDLLQQRYNELTAPKPAADRP